MKRLITGFGLTLALLFTLGALDLAQAFPTFPPKGTPPPGPDGNTLVWRVQLLVKVCDAADAGTGNKVLAALSDTNYTVMDKPGNDFERNSTEAYDLLLTNVATLSDIKYLKIFKGGTDGVCISRLDLFVNERLIYYRIPSPSSQQWLDDTHYGYDSRTLMTASSTLRAHSAWQAWTAPGRPRLLKEEEMVSRLATAVGTGMYDFNVASPNDSLSWDSFTCSGAEGPCVERLDLSAIRVRFDLAYKCVDTNFGDGYCGDSVVQYWADLRFTCSIGGVVATTLENQGGYVVESPNSSPHELHHVSVFVGPQLPRFFKNIVVNYCSTLSVWDVDGGLVEVRLW
jgi:hypothetical protein